MVTPHIVSRESTCIGAGQCVFADPDAFDQDDNGIVQILRAVPEDDQQLAAAKQAVNVCPSRSIWIEDDGA